jgi:anthranilate phosphoribosyltransferase
MLLSMITIYVKILNFTGNQNSIKAMSLNRLEELLKKKGIGPEGSKSLKAEELTEVQNAFLNDSFSLTTRATILTALLMLQPTEIEALWLNQLRDNYLQLLPHHLHFMINHSNAKSNFEKHLCTTLSATDLNYDEAFEAMTSLLTDNSISDFQKGAFLEAQRLKRESFDENKAFFDVLWNHTTRIQTELPVIIDICDNYDGFNRYNNLAPFFAATIASCGYPCIIHGTNSVAPKFGVTSKNVLDTLNADTRKSMIDISHQLSNKEIGWGYLDQSAFHPLLYSLKTIRKEMVKRPFLATFEKMMQPVRAKNGNHLLTGFTHAHYKTEVAAQLKTQNTSYAALITKGLEGSSCPPLNRPTIQVRLANNIIQEDQIDPNNFLQDIHEQVPSKKVEAADAANEGMKALQGNKNEAYFQITYYVSMALGGFELENSEKIKQLIEDNLQSGKVLKHFQNGLF